MTALHEEAALDDLDGMDTIHASCPTCNPAEAFEPSVVMCGRTIVKPYPPYHASQGPPINCTDCREIVKGLRPPDPKGCHCWRGEGLMKGPVRP